MAAPSGNPQAALYADADGNLIGTTETGGANGVGTVYEITGSGFVPPAVTDLPVPEPGTVALCAFGGLGLLRRRSQLS